MNQEIIYKCDKCKKIFNSDILILEPMLDNMEIFTPGVNVKDGIPKCPHCGNLAFFGFEVIHKVR